MIKTEVNKCDSGDSFEDLAGPISELPRNWLSLPPSVDVEGVEYKALGRGAEAAAYVHEDKVVKIGLTESDAAEFLEIMEAQQGWEIADKEQVSRQIVEHWQCSRDMVAQGIASGQIDPRIVANTHIDSQGRIHQTKLEMVTERFDSKRILEYPAASVQALVDEFARCHLQAYRSGICETECSLFSNYGFYPGTNELTIHDLGNITMNLDDALYSISRAPTFDQAMEYCFSNKDGKIRNDFADWFKRGQVRGALKPSLFHLNYYVDHMSSTLTEDSLRANWKNKGK